MDVTQKDPAEEQEETNGGQADNAGEESGENAGEQDSGEDSGS